MTDGDTVSPAPDTLETRVAQLEKTVKTLADRILGDGHGLISVDVSK